MKGIYRTSVCFILLSLPAVAEAQTVPVEPSVRAGANAGEMEDIVVTARKRQESAMNVPVVATAISGEQLQRFNTADLKSLATMVPGLSLGTSILSVGTLVSLRGVGTSALDPGVDASVALNIDGMALSQGLAYASGMFDVESVEVLKGPQSLFYGKSSPGGVISLRTADPKDKFELIGRVGYEVEARERRIEGIVSGPVSDSLKLRLAATYGKQDGFFINSAVATPGTGAAGPSSRRLGPAEDFKIRGTIIFRPSDFFDARIKINYVSDNANYAGTLQNVVCPDGVGPVGRQYVDPTDKCTLDRVVPLVDMDPAAFPGIPNNGVPFNKTTQTFGTAELNFHIKPDLTLTSQTGYYVANSDSLLNATTSSAAMGFFDAVNRFQRRQFTQEFRLTSNFSSPLNFTLGAFLERGRFFDDVTIGRNLLGFPLAAGAAPTAIYVQKGEKTVRIRTESVFGQALYKLTPSLELALGARWTNERRSQLGTFLNPATGVVSVAVPAVSDIAAKNLAPEVSLTYRPTEDLTIFGSLKKGYKSGSFNVSTPPFNGENNAFGDEKVEGGEVGLKARSTDRRLAFNLAGFYYKYSGLQVGANVQAANGVTVTRTVNAGAARAYGIEADLSYRPASIEGLNLRLAVLWNNTKYTKLTNIPCYGGQLVSEGCNLLFNPAANGGIGGYTAQDRSGLPLIRAPRFSGNFGFDYEFDLNDKLTLVVANNNQFQTRSLVSLGYIYYQEAFIKPDVSFTLKPANDRWELALIGKNITNEITSGNCGNGNRMAGNAGGLITGTNTRGPAGVDETGCWADRGREVWLRATVRY